MSLQQDVTLKKKYSINQETPAVRPESAHRAPGPAKLLKKIRGMQVREATLSLVPTTLLLKVEHYLGGLQMLNPDSTNWWLSRV